MAKLITDPAEVTTHDHTALHVAAMTDGVRVQIVLGDEEHGRFMYLATPEQAWAAYDLMGKTIKRRFGPRALFSRRRR